MLPRQLHEGFAGEGKVVSLDFGGIDGAMQARFAQHFARQIDAAHGGVFIDVAQDIGQL